AAASPAPATRSSGSSAPGALPDPYVRRKELTMPIPVSEAVDEAGALARTKASQARNLPRYAIASMLAGAYVGVAIVLLISVGAPLVSAASPFSKLVQGAVFGVALTLVVFAGAEL